MNLIKQTLLLIIVVSLLSVAALGAIDEVFYSNQFELTTDCDATYWTAAGGGAFSPIRKASPVFNGSFSCGASAGAGSNARYYNMGFDANQDHFTSIMVRRADTNSYDVRLTTGTNYEDQFAVGLNTATSTTKFSYLAGGSWVATAVNFDSAQWYNVSWLYHDQQYLVGYINGTEIYNWSVGNKNHSYIYAFMDGTNMNIDSLLAYNLVTSSIALTSPPDADHNNTNTIDFIYIPDNATINPTSCDLYIDGTSENTSGSISPNVNNTLSHTFSGDATYSWNIGCIYSAVETNSSTRTIIIDTTTPIISQASGIQDNFFYFVDGAGRTNLQGIFNFTDDNLYSVNVSTDVEQVFYVDSLTSTLYNYTLDHNVSAYAPGLHYINITAADGHTANKIPKYKYSKRTNELKFDFKKDEKIFEKDYVNIRVKNTLVTIDLEKQEDRYIFTTNGLLRTPKSLTFVIESDRKIDFVGDKYGYEGHLIVPSLGKWIDFEIEGKTGNEKYFVERINDNTVEVTVSNLKNKKTRFHSIGDLNIDSIQIPFYVVNATHLTSTNVLENRTDNMSINYSYGSPLNFTIGTPTAIVDINGTNYTATLASNDENHSLFYYENALPVTNESLNLSHTWYFNYTNLTEGYIGTTQQQQTIYSTLLGICNPTRSNRVLNMSYFDESSNNPINLSNGFQMVTTDGVRTTTHVEQFSGNTSDELCTLIDPSDIIVNWNMYGSLTMNKTGYVTRIYDIDLLSPLSISNSPTVQLDLFLIAINESTTVSYTWLTNNFQEIDGTMKVYKCNADGTQDLVESVPIINGGSSANLELFTQAYSYQVVVDDTVYTDANAWTRCHIESETSLSFTVDTQPINIDEIIGLKSIVCSLEKAGNNTVTMTWGPNPENSVDDVQGCIIAERTTVSGLQEVYNNCTVEEDFTRTVHIEDNGNNYYVRGVLHQGGYSAYCGEQVSFLASENGGLFGVSGLLATFLLCASLVLIFAGNGELQLIALSMGVVTSFFLGIFTATWELTVTIVIFLLFVIAIGRYTRK